jgi:hypothetical protein
MLPDITTPLGDGTSNLSAHISVRLDEFRYITGRHPQEVINHEDLAVAVRAGANPN